MPGGYMITFGFRSSIDLTESIVSLRGSHARMVVLDETLKIVTADPAARRMLDDMSAAQPDRLPAAIERAVRAWLVSTSAEAEFVSTPVPGFLVRASRLYGDAAWIGMLVERFVMREELASAVRRFGLSRRELDVLRLVLEGDSACEIAQRLSIGEYTVGDYLKRIFIKTQVRNRSEMIAKVLGWHNPAKSEREQNAAN